MHLRNSPSKPFRSSLSRFPCLMARIRPNESMGKDGREKKRRSTKHQEKQDAAAEVAPRWRRERREKGNEAFFRRRRFRLSFVALEKNNPIPTAAVRTPFPPFLPHFSTPSGRRMSSTTFRASGTLSAPSHNPQNPRASKAASTQQSVEQI